MHQQNMLQDYIRTGTYYASIVENPTDFEGKAVMDVGCGSGILSLFAAQVRPAGPLVGLGCGCGWVGWGALQCFHAVAQRPLVGFTAGRGDTPLTLARSSKPRPPLALLVSGCRRRGRGWCMHAAEAPNARLLTQTLLRRRPRCLSHRRRGRAWCTLSRPPIWPTTRASWRQPTPRWAPASRSCTARWRKSRCLSRWAVDGFCLPRLVLVWRFALATGTRWRGWRRPSGWAAWVLPLASCPPPRLHGPCAACTPRRCTTYWQRTLAKSRGRR